MRKSNPDFKFNVRFNILKFSSLKSEKKFIVIRVKRKIRQFNRFASNLNYFKKLFINDKLEIKSDARGRNYAEDKNEKNNNKENKYKITNKNTDNSIASTLR